MKIAVYGATGNVGAQLVAEAVSRGHRVTALSRNEGTTADGVTWQRGDANDRVAVASVAAAHDVVVSALGPSRSPGADRSAFVGTVATLAGAVGHTRLVVVGGAGSLLAAPGVRLVDTAGFPEVFKGEALAHAEALEALRSGPAELDWTYLSPAPELGTGERTGQYVLGIDEPVGSQISLADYAVALLDELEHPAHRRQRFTVAN